LRDDRRRVAAGLALVAALLGATPGPQAQAPGEGVAPLARFDGRWYEIAGYGSWWQRRCVGDTTLEIQARSAVEAAVRSRCRVAAGVEVRDGRLRADGDNGRWRMRFAPGVFAWLPAVWGDFWVVGHDAAVTWMAVGERSHGRLAILARAVALDESGFAQAIAAARRAGFDVTALTRVRHDVDASRALQRAR